jgi:hypothetical protein
MAWSITQSPLNLLILPALGSQVTAPEGYLATLGASITNNKYKTCITWSGVSDLSSLAGTNQTAEPQFSMSGLAP